MEQLGFTVIMPPPTSKRTISLGVAHSPEFACLPIKICIGNLIEAHELGADTFLMAGGVGPCRFGLYAQLEKEILEDAGLGYKALIIEPPGQGPWQFLKQIKKIGTSVSWMQLVRGFHFSYQKICIIDELEKLVQQIRPRERIKGTADKIFTYALKTFDQAKNYHELCDAYGLARQKLLHIPQWEYTKVLKIGVVGEIYTLLEPFASMDIERKLGALGAEVTRSIYLSDWVREHLLGGLLPGISHNMYHKLASPFLNHFVGGHGIESVGASVNFAKAGYDGIVHIAPFTCMPEIVAHTVLPRASKHCNIPVMTIYVDEQTGQAGLNTRLEAFLDLLRDKKNFLDRDITMC